MKNVQKFPAIPLLTHDPYFSIWLLNDNPADACTRHWTGERKRLEVSMHIHEKEYRLLGEGKGEPAELVGVEVSPTITSFRYVIGSQSVSLTFCSPLLLDDLDRLSTPISMLRVKCDEPDATLSVMWHDDICYDGTHQPEICGCSHQSKNLCHAMMGRLRQNILSHSGDGICIDWGYAWMSSDIPVDFIHKEGNYRLSCCGTMANGVRDILLGYDDIASVNYFGSLSKAWYARNGKTMRNAMEDLWTKKNQVWSRCIDFDKELLRRAELTGGIDYAKLVSVAYRQAVSAHKLIADEQGRPVFLSKENNSNGCIGTVDVSYPSVPLFLLYNPELVRGMCRPILRFAKCPIWNHEYAPHDVGRYPHATGQVYGLDWQAVGGDVCGSSGDRGVFLPYYQFSEENEVYLSKWQMPVEECGDMLLMLAAALRADGNGELIRENFALLQKWAEYLEKNGSDPGEQLCTDDFAGHLAGNVNLAMKASCALAAFGYICRKMGDDEAGANWLQKAQKIAKVVCQRADCGNHTSLTLDGSRESWSLKYNMIWDLLFAFDFCSREWFDREIEWYLTKLERYGVPLDSREKYTKSDWLMWVTAMSDKKEQRALLCSALVRYLEETPSRVPFSDWYDTKSGRSIAFVARSVQGGVFMPMLRDYWALN